MDNNTPVQAEDQQPSKPADITGTVDLTVKNPLLEKTEEPK
jgi:hypothetical protein